MRNGTTEYMTGIEIKATFFDEAGTVILEQPAIAATAQLKPGETTTFALRVDGTFGFGSLQFEARGNAYRVRPKPPSAEAGDGEGEGPTT